MIKKANLKISLLTSAVIVICLGIVMASPVSAQVPIPHAFYGDIKINGEPAPVGTIVEARGDGVKVGLEGNPIMTTEVGKYGTEGYGGAKLVVQGDIVGNTVLSFYINGEPADQTYTWKSMEITRLSLTATITATLPPSKPPTTQPRTFQGILFGKEQNISISDTGEIQEAINVSANLPKGKVEINIKAGTIALNKNGSPLTNLTSEVDATPPPAPEGFGGILLPCNFGPNGATFDPPITLTFHYDPADIPENTNEEELVLAYYDNSAGKWVPLPSEVNTANNTITASVEHFTSFAILVPQAETSPEAPTPPTKPATKPGTTSPEKTPTPAPAPAGTTEKTPTTEKAPSVPAEQPGATNNWWFVLGGIIAAVVLTITFVIVRRIYIRNRYY